MWFPDTLFADISSLDKLILPWTSRLRRTRLQDNSVLVDPCNVERLDISETSVEVRSHTPLVRITMKDNCKDTADAETPLFATLF